MQPGVNHIQFCWIDNSGRKSVGAFKQLFAHCYKPLYYFAFELIGQKEKAEEIVADSFLSIWQLEEDPESFQNLKSCLYLFTRNACYDYLRRAGRLPAERATELYSLNGWEEDFQNKVIEAELLASIAQDKKRGRI